MSRRLKIVSDEAASARTGSENDKACPEPAEGSVMSEPKGRHPPPPLACAPAPPRTWR
jgi:hypothetical protein